MSLDISPTYIAWFSAGLLLLVLAYWSLKLLFMSPRGRLHRRDCVFLAVSTFLGTGLLTFLLLDLYYYNYEFRRDSAKQLKRLAYVVNEHFRSEEKAIWKQLDQFNLDQFNKDLSGLGGSEAKRSRGSPERTGTVSERECFTRQFGENTSPVRVCGRAKILADFKNLDYPFFQTVFWIDGEGTQRIKWDVRDQVTPFLNLHESHEPYYPKISLAYEWWDKKTKPVTAGIEPVYSSNTGENIVVFWKLFEPPDGPIVTAALVTRPLSLIGTALPGGLQYAVVDSDGLVLFHSDPHRNLIEHFFDECDQGDKLRSLVMGRGSHDLSIMYLGRKHQAYVTPFGSSTEDKQGGPWSLVAFQDGLILETMNLETLTLGSILLLLYGALLATLWGLTYLFWRKYPKKWFWPSRNGSGAYRQLIFWNLALSVLLFVGIFWIFPASPSASPFVTVCGAVAIPLIAILLNFLRIADLDSAKQADPADTASRPGNGDGSVKGKPASEPSGWRTEYLWVRFSLLLVVAVLPSFAFFKVAYDFEKKLFIKQGQINFARALDDRMQQRRKEYQKVRLGSAEDQIVKLQPKDDGGTYQVGFFETTVKTTVELPPSLTGFAENRLDSLFNWIRPSYNVIAEKTQVVIPNKSADGVFEWCSDQENQKNDRLVLIKLNSPFSTKGNTQCGP